MYNVKDIHWSHSLVWESNLKKYVISVYPKNAVEFQVFSNLEGKPSFPVDN